MEICISENIKRLRKDNGLTQEMLADVLHISPQSISKWERGDAYPDISMQFLQPLKPFALDP